MPKLILDEPDISTKPKLVPDEEPKQSLIPKLVLDEEESNPKNWVVEGLKGTARDIVQPFKDIGTSYTKFWGKEFPQEVNNYFTAPEGQETLARKHGEVAANIAMLGMLGKEALTNLSYTPTGQRLMASFQKKSPMSAEELLNVGRFGEAARQDPSIKQKLIQERITPETASSNVVEETTSKFMPPALINPTSNLSEAIKRNSFKNGFAGNIKLNKYEPSVQEGILKTAENYPEVVSRPVISNQELKQRAGAIEETPLVKSLVSAPEGTLESELLKTRQGVSDFVKTALAKDLTDFKTEIDPIVTGIKDKMGELSKATATMGRGLQSFRIPTIDRISLVKTIDDKISQVKNDPILGKEKALVDKLKELRGYVGGEEFNPTIFDKAYEVWLNSILANPMTHVVNTASNALFTMYKPVEKLFSAAVETPYALATGKRFNYFSEIPQMLKGAINSFSSTPESLNVGSKLDYIKPPAIQGTVGEVARIPTKALQAEDNIFKRINGMMELYARSYATAKGEGLTGPELKTRTGELIKNPTADIKSDVYKEQLYRTFQDELGKVGNTVMNLRDSVPGVRWIMPFIKTPANIMKRALERTPFVAGKIGLKATQGQYNQKELFGDLGLLALAGTTAAGLAHQYLKGNITGNVPKDKGDRDLFYRQGKQPNSFKIGNKWVPFSRYEPLGLSISLITNLIQDYKQSEKEVPEDKVTDAVFGLMKTLTNKSYLSGMTNFLNTIQEPERYGEKFASRAVAGFVPYSGLAKFFTGIVDDTVRYPSGVVESVKAQIPGLSKTVRPKLNAFGEEIKKPGLMSKETISPVDKELITLGISIGLPSNRVLGKTLTPDEYNKYLGESGKIIKTALGNLFQKPGYKNLPAQEKAKAVETITRQARDKARDLLFKQ
jgi:hypothetical protein